MSIVFAFETFYSVSQVNGFLKEDEKEKEQEKEQEEKEKEEEDKKMK